MRFEFITALSIGLNTNVMQPMDLEAFILEFAN